MAQISNITVKKFDGTTDITYTATVGATGKEPAMWKSTTVSAVPNQQPTFKLSSRPNTKGTTRIMEYEYDYPILGTVNGVTAVIGNQKGNGVIPVLQEFDWTQVREGIAQHLNLLASTLVKTAMQEGYAPRP